MNTTNNHVINNQFPESCTISIILTTENSIIPKYYSVERIKELIPREISSQIIVVQYNALDGEADTDVDLSSGENQLSQHDKLEVGQIGLTDSYQSTICAKVGGKFSSAVMKGLTLSSGQFILVIDADFPYPQEVIIDLVKEVVNSPNSIIIASRYAKGAPRQKLPFSRNALSKGARMIIHHGLKLKNVKDPLSGCFGLSRIHMQEIQIERDGVHLLLEILVKINSVKNDNITIKEIPFRQKGEHVAKKLDLERILSYSKAIWHLYLYGRKSHKVQNKPDYEQQKKHKSVLFLSKAGRFFTVGASGLLVNFAASFLLSNLLPNIWYMHATLFGIILSITSNFLLNKIWTFEDRNFSPRHFLRQYLLFLTLCTLGAVIQLSAVYVFVEYSHITYAVSLIMAVCIASLSNFLLNKRITFGEKIWE